MILSAIAAKLKQRAKGDFKGRHYEAALIVQAVSWYLRYGQNERNGPPDTHKRTKPERGGVLRRGGCRRGASGARRSGSRTRATCERLKPRLRSATISDARAIAATS
jgi:hypothetical protein